MAQRGGKRPGAGRPKGRRNVATIKQLGSISELARAHAADAINTLVAVATSGESESAKVSAANAILDRGYGKANQPVSGAVAFITLKPQDLDKLNADELAALEAAYPVLEKLGLVGGAAAAEAAA